MTESFSPVSFAGNKIQLPSKLICPESHNVYARTALFERLDAARTHSLIWVNAPGGSGKTILASSYLRARALPHIWYRIDGGDNDPASFFHYLSMLALSILPSGANSLPALTPEYLPQLEFFTRRFFEQFFSIITTPAVWVLDDYQQAGAATQLNEILHIASTIAPKDLTVMVLSRNDPPPVFVRQRAYQTLTLIGWDGLKLSRQDAIGLAKLHQQQDDTVVNACYEASQGWMAGFILLLTQGSDATLPLAGFSADNKQVLFDYFASEIFKDFPESTQTILLKTAWLPELTPEITGALTGDSSAWSVLCGFQRNNFFILQKAGAERIFEFHPLFLEFLKANAHLDMDDSALNALQEQAAEVLVKFQRAEEAIPLYLTTGNWQALADLLQTVAQPLVMQGRHQTLAVWLTAVPEQIMQQNAWLRFWLGVSRTPIDLISARQDFSAAYSLFKGEQNVVGLYLAWLNCVGTYQLEWSDFTGLDLWITEFTELQAKHPQFPGIDIELQVYTALIVLIVYRQPQHPQRNKWIQHAHRLLETNSDSPYSLHLSINLLHFSMWFENSTAYSRIAKTIIQLAHNHDLPPLSFMLARVLIAIYHWSTGDALACFKDVDEGLQCAQTHGIVLMEFLLSAQGVYGGLINGNLDIAEVYLKRMEAIPMGKRFLDVGHYRLLVGTLALQRGEIGMSIENFEISLELTIRAGSAFPEASTRTMLGLALSQAGQYTLAKEHVFKAEHIAKTINSLLMDYMCLLANAYIDLDHNRKESGLNFLRHALTLNRKCGGLVIGQWGPKVMTYLYAAALAADIETPYVQNLIRSMHLAQFAPDNAPAQWPWPVKVETLGEFNVYIDGEPLHFTGKVQHKPLELLMALIAFGGCNVPQNQLIDALWPDAEGDAGYRALITAIHRLRKLLNCQQAIVFSDGTLSMDQHYVRVDVQHFGLHRNTLIVLTEQECALFLHCYKGPFLAEIEASWVLKTRARLRDYYQIALRQTGEALEYQGKLQDATALYLSAAHVEPGLEILHQQLIRVYLAQQRNVEALEAFGNCKCLLASLQNRNPSRETEALVAAYSA